MVKGCFFCGKRGSFRALAATVAFFVSFLCVGHSACARLPENDGNQGGFSAGKNQSEHEGNQAKELLEERLRRGLFGYAEVIGIEDLAISAEELCAIFSELRMSEPYLFFVSGEMSYTYGADGCVLSVRPKYTMNLKEASRARTLCDERVSEIAELAAREVGGDAAQEFGGSDRELEKCLFVYDYFCRNFEYDHSGEGDDAYKLFSSGRGTCRAFSLAFSAVLGRLGINCSYAVSDEMGHVWSLVRIGGEWYHCDVTWGACLYSAGADLHRRHFLCSDAAAAENGHKNFRTFCGISCLSERYDRGGFD